jgi:hypothetical protein
LSDHTGHEITLEEAGRITILQIGQPGGDARMPLNLIELFDEEKVTPVIAAVYPSLLDATTITELDVQGAQLNKIHKPGGLSLTPRDYWNSVKQEFWLLACTNNRKYASHRKTIPENAKKSQATAISTISVTLGATLGIVPGLLTPFVAMLIKFCLKVGLEAFCGAVRKSKQQAA